MKADQIKYDLAIIGAGLAGLSLSIQLAKQGYTVILFEKERFPFHKVCGEYVSMESWSFLKSLGLQLEEMKLPVIDTLILSAPNGKALITKLPLGGFGISRFLLDALLAGIAKKNGVVLLEEAKVEAVNFDEEFVIKYKTVDNGNVQSINSKICCAAYGKRSNLDIKWNRIFLQARDKRLDNYVGIKYHIQTSWKQNVIGLHNFKKGYCGISKIEEEKYCLCYMTKAENLKDYKGIICDMEKEVLFQNPHLKKIFSESKVLDQFPISISQINFNKKTTVENNVLMLGDAAGTITPLCGNGMSMALHSSKIAAINISKFLTHSISRQQMEQLYTKSWNKNFAARLHFGRILQRFFGDPMVTNLFVQTFKLLPFLATFIIRKTHGKSF
jgi:flavin-dependent dehydrogenase